MLDTAQDLQRYVGYFESVEAYLQAAIFAETNELEYRKIIVGYEQAGEMMSIVDASQAIVCIQSAIDICVKHGDINVAIQKCMEYGYKIFKSTKDKQKRDEFWDQGKRLRVEHKIPHSCVITKFEERKYYFDCQKVKEDIRKFNVEEEIDGRVIIKHKSLCRKCIGPYNQLCDYFDEIAEEYHKYL
ncbi:hypothetical protein RF11_11614 [Thelohanellus kitauei]|uniref:Uncharacterized protein n=1 Tax=Thelohanellus kitauei TaxID=669202 RepID=A0A0C2MJD1_THEKT|nr:hypothetical protein RF11_11614 [Thelohanellus kitauei]